MDLSGWGEREHWTDPKVEEMKLLWPTKQLEMVSPPLRRAKEGETYQTRRIYTLLDLC